MANFHETHMGRKFYEVDVPKAVKALEEISENLNDHEEVEVEVVLGQADISAALESRDYESKTIKFNSVKEAIAYVRGVNDANGYMEAGIVRKQPANLPIPSDITDLYIL